MGCGGGLRRRLCTRGEKEACGGDDEKGEPAADAAGGRRWHSERGVRIGGKKNEYGGARARQGVSSLQPCLLDAAESEFERGRAEGDVSPLD